MATANLVIQGNQAVLVRDGESSSTSSSRARACSTCSPLSHVVDDLDARIVELRPTADAGVTRLAAGT